ncbi:MAG: hypothetical protein K2I03_05155 [Lachnospiraceae bacterium]|nr:hypothetical protein [Lachnospiraceae bacterium]MDE5780851.1 hypothetical protein [Lachnospiraceae bacterium]MDE6231749.1 hypothetical protein [Lachnospiraceae bacterium]MDE6252783.1 hypothetical protein [Lachnospiraceae bacterium]
MINEMKIRGLVKELEKLDPNDPRIEDYWKLLTKEMSINVDETIEFINSCNENEVYWLSPIFEDISWIFQSQKFIEALKRLQEKYPKLDLEVDIMYAEMSMK